jgi:hypothetical protein
MIAANRLAICSGWLLKTYLSTVTKRNNEDKTFTNTSPSHCK